MFLSAALTVVAVVMSSEPMRALPAVSGGAGRSGNEARTHWVATRTEFGRILASGSGLIELESGAWRQITTEGNFDWESLAADGDGRVWAGAANEIGVYESSPSGLLQYRSLTSLLPEGERDLGDIWHAFAGKSAATFVCRDRVVLTDGVRAKSWQLPSYRRLFAWEDGGDVYIGGKDGQISRMTPNGPEVVQRTFIDAKYGISWAERIDFGEWLAFADGGLVSASPERNVALREVNQSLTGSAPVSYMRLQDGRLAIGTFNKGLYLIDTDSGRFEQLDDRSGLPSRRVTGLVRGGDDWLWVVTARGLSRVSLSDAVSVMKNEPGFDSSSIRFVERVGDSLLIAANAGRFVLSENGGSKTFTKHSDSLNYGSARSRAVLLCGGMTGLYKITGEKLERLIEEENDVVAIVPSPIDDGIVFYATGKSIRAARWIDGNLAVAASVVMLRQIDSMVADATGDLWIASGQVISRIGFDDVRVEFTLRNEFSPPELESASGREAKLFRVGDSVLALLSGKLMEPKRDTGRLEAVPEFRDVEFLGAAAGSRGEAWTLARPVKHKGDSPRLVRLLLDEGSLVAEEIHAPGIFAMGSPTNIHLVETKSGERELWLGARDGIVRVDPARVVAAGPPHSVDVRMTLSIDDAERTVSAESAELPFNPGSISFYSSAPDIMTGDLLVETRLEGAETSWMPAGARHSREFARLADGAYEFQVRAVDALGRPGPVTSRAFTVLPPWYRTTTAVTSFCVTALGFGFVGWQLRMRASRRRAEELEGLVEDRTRELERVNAEKTRFIARMNHEIRNPLNGLLGAIGILEQYSHRGREARMVQILRACADHLGAVVEDVLDFSSIEGGRIVVQDRAVSIAAMLEAVPRMLHAESERTGTEIITTIAPDVPAVVIADPDRIRQILMNFVGNALKYAPGEPVHVEVTAASVDGAQSLRFAVRDHGPGISEADKPMLFSMFERGKGATGLNARGMGIGLATCRLLARRMGGEVGVISGLGEGSEFFLKLPLKVEAGVTPLPETQPHTERFKVACLIVEDQEFNRVILKDMLDRFGCKVDEAPSAETALRLAAMNRYDVVFTDLELPDAAPGEILNMLRNQQSAANTSVPTLVVTTAYATENVRQMCLDAGATAFLAKPLSSPKVLAVLREIDAARRPAPSVETPVQERAVGTDNANVAQLARIRGCSVESVAIEIGTSIADEVRLLRACVKAGSSRETAHHAHRLLSLSALAITPELAGVATGIQHGAHEGRFPTEERLTALDAAAAGAREKLGAIKSGAAAGGRNRVPGRNEPTASSRSD